MLRDQATSGACRSRVPPRLAHGVQSIWSAPSVPSLSVYSRASHQRYLPASSPRRLTRASYVHSPESLGPRCVLSVRDPLGRGTSPETKQKSYQRLRIGVKEKDDLAMPGCVHCSRKCAGMFRVCRVSLASVTNPSVDVWPWLFSPCLAIRQRARARARRACAFTGELRLGSGSGGRRRVSSIGVAGARCGGGWFKREVERASC